VCSCYIIVPFSFTATSYGTLNSVDLLFESSPRPHSLIRLNRDSAFSGRGEDEGHFLVAFGEVVEMDSLPSNFRSEEASLRHLRDGAIERSMQAFYSLRYHGKKSE